MYQEFKKFILRGNVVDLAVAVVIGAAFNQVVQSFVKDFINPLITGFSHSGKLVQGQLVIAHRFYLNWGDFLNALLSFVIIALVVFFFVVQPINKMNSLARRRKGAEDSSDKKCPYCMSTIPVDAVKCAFCTSKLTVEKATAK